MNAGPITRLRELLEKRPPAKSISKEARALYAQMFCEDLPRENISWGGQRQKVKSWAAWKRFENAPADQQIMVALLAADRYDPTGYLHFHMSESAEKLLANQILRTKLPFTEADIAQMVYSAAASHSTGESQSLLTNLRFFEAYLAAHPERTINQTQAGYFKDWDCNWDDIRADAGVREGVMICPPDDPSGRPAAALHGIIDIWPEFPAAAIAGLLERHCKNHQLSDSLRDAVETLYLRYFILFKAWRNTTDVAKILARLRAILQPDGDKDFAQLSQGVWGKLARKQLSQLNKEDQQFWADVFNHAALGANKAKPSKKWTDEAGRILAKSHAPKFHDMLNHWLADLKPDPRKPDTSFDLLKSIIWMAAQLDEEKTVLTVGRFASLCYSKIPDYGARSTKLGNACLFSLSQSKKTDAAVAELVRIRQKSKYPSVKASADKALATIAERLGIDIEKLEQASLPDFGLLKDGECIIAMGEEAARLSLSRYKVRLHWLGRDGKPRKSVPVEAKRSFPDLVKEAKQQQKDISSTLSAQIAYLESAYLADHSWTREDWVKLYLEHPLRREIAENLVWQLEDDSCFLGKDGAPATDGQIRLWHPLFSSDADIAKWQARIEKENITQPFKQVHREVYRLSDQELKSATHSNRFAAHIVRQHQFRELCLARSWAYHLQGSFDSWNTPVRSIPRFGIEARFYVEVAFEDPDADYTIISHLTTGKLEFRNSAGKKLALREVPAIVYSEIARDADLFTSVASKARNASWLEPYENELFHQYWQKVVHGKLSPAGESRRTLLEWLIPQLEFGKKLQISGNFVEVTGKERIYRIHIGSANVITKGHSISIRYRASGRNTDPSVSNIAGAILPFVGDTILTSILNTAATLIEDDKVKDKALLEELERVKRIELSS